MPFYIYAWIASFCAGFYVITTKLTSKYAISNPWLFNFLAALFTLLFTAPLAIMYKASMPHNWTPIFFVALTTVIWNVLFIFSTYMLDVTVIAPLFNFRAVFAVLLSFFFLHERLTSQQFMYVILIIIAGIFVTVDEKFSLRSFFRLPVLIGLSAMFFLALSEVLTKPALIQNDLWTVNLWTRIITQVLLIFTVPFFFSKFKNIKINQIIPVAAIGFFLTLTNIALISALKVNVGITSVIMALPISMILTFLLSFFAPNLLEKHTFKVYAIRFTSTIVMIYSAFQISH